MILIWIISAILLALSGHYLFAGFKHGWLLSVLLAAGVLGLYFYLGSPDIKGRPLRGREAEFAELAMNNSAIDGEILSIETALAEDTTNLENLISLAGLYDFKAEYEKSIPLWNRANELTQNLRGDLLSAEGASITYQSDSVVTPAAKSLFEEALTVRLYDPRARYFLGLAELQAGNRENAIEWWQDLLRDSPENAPWVADIISRLEELAQEDGLQKDAYLVENEDEGNHNNLEVELFYVAELLGNIDIENSKNEPLPEDIIEVLENILRLDSAAPMALMMLSINAANEGDMERAALLEQRLEITSGQNSELLR